MMQHRGRFAMTIKTGTESAVPEVLSVGKVEAARLLGVSLRTVDRLIALKHLPVRRLGRRVLIPRSSLQNLMRADHPTQAA
jgi:excisionase family DNA binding protein